MYAALSRTIRSASLTSFLRSAGLSVRVCRSNRSSNLGSEKRPQFRVSPVLYTLSHRSGSSMNSTGGNTHHLEVARLLPFLEPRGGFEEPVLGLDPDLPPLLDDEHREVLIGQANVAVLEHDLEAVREAGLGQQASGLRAILLRVRAEARELLELCLGHRPGRAGAHQACPDCGPVL